MDLKRAWQKAKDKDEARLLWAASSLCFFGFSRSGEVTIPSEREYDHQSHLCYEDVRVDCHTAPSLKATKTDPFRQGVVLYLGATGKNCAQWQQC